jgi:membrane protease YdiL (CAAX protease family)
MEIFLYIGLAISLGGPLLLLVLSKMFQFKLFSLPSRLVLWIFAIIVFIFAELGGGFWLKHIGIQSFGWFELVSTIIATLVILIVLPLLQRFQKRLGGNNSKQLEHFQKIADFSFPYRVFIVLTAAVTEEILFRGYIVGIGQYIFGSLAIAFIISLIAFVLVHFRWGISHLVSVFCSALVFTFLFVVTNNLFACILAHFIVDTFGFILLPSLMKRRKEVEISSAKEA